MRILDVSISVFLNSDGIRVCHWPFSTRGALKEKEEKNTVKKFNNNNNCFNGSQIFKIIF